MRIERCETRGMRSRFSGKTSYKYLIRPFTQSGNRAEVHRQWDNASNRGIAESAADDVVDVDVGSSEAIDRLLWIADDEQGARSQRNRAPVGAMLFNSGG